MSVVAKTSLHQRTDPPITTPEQATRKFAEQALDHNKVEGLKLAVRARWAALFVIAVMLPFVNPNWDVLYYHFLILLFALIGWMQLRVGAVGLSRTELLLMFCDLLLMTIICIAPNPFNPVEWPAPAIYKFSNFIYFFVFLSAATLAYSWRTVIAMGTWTTGLWIGGIIWVYFQPIANPEITTAISNAIGGDQRLLAVIDPNRIDFGVRLQEIVVFLIVATTLGIAARRSSVLLLNHAEAVQERTNLARYFSPNVATELAQNDEPLKQVRTQNVAVLFVDIIGFTAFADGKSPDEIINTLRDFHGRMESQVFRHSGTLDKYLGDGLMATFGTPFLGDADALNALLCAQAMIGEMEELNSERLLAGESEISASFGLHYGPVVLGDIGAQRLEFAVIGTTVNIAARLEAITRNLDCALVASDALIERARVENGNSAKEFGKFNFVKAQEIRGIEKPIAIWTLPRIIP